MIGALSGPPEVIERIRGRGGELQLQRRGAHYEVIYNGVFLMATYNGASERAAVRRALERLRPVEAPRGLRILMGGLGVGYSLREALRAPRVAAVTVAEIEPAVIAWNRSYLKQVNGNALDDPRVTLLNEPFETVIPRAAAGAAAAAHRAGGYHAVLVDTDNGSTWLSRPENGAIYSRAGLEMIRGCLLPGGAACFWCARRERGLEQRLASVFGAPVYETVPEKTGREGGFYLVERPSGPAGGAARRTGEGREGI